MTSGATPAPAVAGLPFTAPYLLAPMEGVTEPCFRELVLARNGPDDLGGVFTEFARVVDHPLPVAHLRRHLGPARFPQPVGIQLMGSDLDALARSVEHAFAAGAPIVDLNFGCPAKGALRTCAGSALLRDPAAVERLVRCAADAAGARPVSAKIRAGYDDDRLLEDLARAAEQGGARLLTVHCRTRREGYRPEVDWTRLARAAAAVGIPVCGNGGARTRADLERMRRETGCAFAMAGQGALADPWIFSGRAASPAEAGAFLLEYAELLRARGGFGERGVAGRVKQLLNHWTAGRGPGGGWMGRDRKAWLRVRDAGELLGRIARATGARRSGAAEAPPAQRAPSAAATAASTSSAGA